MPKPELQISPEGESYRVVISITNTGTKPIDPGVRESSLLVDGVRNPSWSFAAGNGAGTTADHRLEAGQRVSVERVLPARSLGGPGVHTFVAEVAGERSNPVRVGAD